MISHQYLDVKAKILKEMFKSFRSQKFEQDLFSEYPRSRVSFDLPRKIPTARRVFSECRNSSFDSVCKM